MSSFPPITGLRYFEAVSRLGSMTMAAKELHVTHSAISQQIKLLEEFIGVSLFIRQGRQIRISEEGRLYALQVRKLLDHIAEATRQIQVIPRQKELTISVTPSFGNYWLMPRLPMFQEKFPDIKLRLQATLSVTDLHQESIDIAIRMGLGHWGNMETHYLFTDELMVIASPAFQEGNLPQTPEEILSSHLIHSTESWQTWQQAAGVDHIYLHPTLCINDSNLIIDAVRRAEGIALERRSLVHDAIQRGELIQLSPYTVPYPYPHWLVYRTNNEKSLEQRIFAEWLSEEVKNYLKSCPSAQQAQSVLQ